MQDGTVFIKTKRRHKPRGTDQIPLEMQWLCLNYFQTGLDEMVTALNTKVGLFRGRVFDERR